MTWFVTEEGYELFFNRDELNTRSQALPPSIQSTQIDVDNAISYISPTDTDAGGTWIAVNEFGFSICLLNHYQFEQIPTYKNWISRGEVVRQFVITSDLNNAESQFMNMDLNDYRAFRMFIIERSGQNRLFVWDGHQARVERNVTSPKSSSSVDAKNVKEYRKKLFFDLNLAERKNTQSYLNYHSSHIPIKSKASVCMHRKDASTVSLSVIKANAESVSFAYADGSPCEVEISPPISLNLLIDDPVSKKNRLAMP